MIPNTKVFVGSLPGGTKPEELRRLFESFGVVTECDIMNKCGFVWMQTEEMAQSAISALNNTMFNGQPIVVEPGRIKDRGQKRQGNAGGQRSGGGGGGYQRGGNQGGSRGGNSGGPMRRGRDGPMRRNAPYGRGGDFGGNRRQDNSQMPPMPVPPSFGGGGFNDNFGFSNQDRRGFALPNQYDNNSQQQRGGGFQRGGMRQGGGGGGSGSGFGNFNRNDNMRQGFDRNSGFNGRDRQNASGGGQKPNFNRNQGGGGGGNFGRGPNNQGMGNPSQAYNQQFPPLGAGGPRTPRNNQGPPRMQNRRFQ